MIHLRLELPDDADAITDLTRIVLGARSTHSPAARMRAGSRSIADLCLVALDQGSNLVGTLRFWPVAVGTHPAIQLGPLAVRPERRGEGFGRALVREGLERARRAGHRVVVLIGDPGYYRTFGFLPATALGLHLPTPEDEARFQVLALEADALAGVSGIAGPRHDAIAVRA
ncbi:MAG: N-acetyltransferase [Alphaproteobacteria bacterium]|nr:N-acetyltransferase [Alphaproteobacteria bacterium]